MGRRGWLVCYGASNTYGYDPADFYSGRYDEDSRWPELAGGQMGLLVKNYGYCGEQIPHTRQDRQMVYELLSAAVHAAAGAPVQLCVMLGTNDLLSQPHFTAKDCAGRMEAFLAGLQKQFTEPACDVRLRLLTPPAMRKGTWTDARCIRASAGLSDTYRQTAQDLGIAFSDPAGWELPVVFDGVHLSAQGHRRLAARLVREMTDDAYSFVLRT